MTDTLQIATYNIHKGFSFFKRQMVIHEMREHLRVLNADLVFLQEVQGNHKRHARRFDNWPEQPQCEFIADSVWTVLPIEKTRFTTPVITVMLC